MDEPTRPRAGHGRRTALIVAGTVLAVGLIVTPVAVLASQADDPVRPSGAAPAPTVTVPTEPPTSSDTSSPSEAPSTTAVAPATSIPTDFDLAVDLDSGDEVVGPSAGSAGVLDPGMCGTAVWPPSDGVDRLAVTARGPEYRSARELATFPSADEAVAAIAFIRDTLERCPSSDGETRANDVTYAADDAAVGYDAVTFSALYRSGLTGNRIFQFVRVGNAVLATEQAGEWSSETVGDGIVGLTDSNGALTQQMCLFTETGC